MRLRPHPFVPLPSNKKMIPQGVLPPPPAPSDALANQRAARHARAPVGSCFNCGQACHFACECPNRD